MDSWKGQLRDYPNYVAAPYQAKTGAGLSHEPTHCDLAAALLADAN